MTLGFSQKKLGILAGMHENSAAVRISQYEMGKYTPNFLTLSRIAAVSNCPVEFFFSQDDRMAEIICLIGKLQDSSKDALLGRVKIWVLEYDSSLFLTTK